MSFKIKKKYFSIIISTALIALVLVLHEQKKKQLKNANYVLGNVFGQDVRGSGGKKVWLYSFKVNGELYRGYDRKSNKYPLKIGQYCLIRYAKEDIENSEIVYERSPIDVLKELYTYDEIKADLLHIGEPFKDLIFIKYKYIYKGQVYEDRSRIYTHEFEKLKLTDSTINLRVSKRFPELNDVRFGNLTKKDFYQSPME